MGDTWRTLLDVGLPDGAVRPPPSRPMDPEAVRAAVLALTSGMTLPQGRVAPLLAWLRAWQHHWSSHFTSVLGADGPAAVANLAARLEDENRYLKLRRIAVANLACIL